MAKKKFGTCVYCGNFGKVTRDHVIPKSLFVPPYPEDFITVPACTKCNGEKAKNDDFLRDFLVADYRADKNPIVRTLLYGKGKIVQDGNVTRAFMRNHSKLSREAVMKAQIKPLMSPGGVFLGEYPTFEVDENRINLIFEELIRGLYYHILKKPLPKNFTFELWGVQPHNYTKLIENFKAIKTGKIGEFAFEYALWYSTETPERTMWLLLFYEAILFISFTDK
jgi:hypothetical protein